LTLRCTGIEVGTALHDARNITMNKLAVDRGMALWIIRPPAASNSYASPSPSKYSVH
jgi:hypothetical protein